VHGDLTALAARAVALHRQAEESRATAREMHRRAGSADWRSVAGSAFAARLGRLGLEHLQAAGALDEAATALEEHVRAVEHTQTLIAAAERWVTSLAAAASADDGVLPGLLRHLPSTGSPDWLDVAARLRTRGW